MDYDYNDRKQASVYSKRLKAGKRRTYFFDVRETRGNDFFLTITESRKRFNEDGYDRHKIFLYKEDFNKFQKALGEAVDHVKTELMPDYDFDSFSHEGEQQEEAHYRSPGARPVSHNDSQFNSHSHSPYNNQSNNQSDNNTQGAGETEASAATGPEAAAEPSQAEKDNPAIEAEPMQQKSTESQDVTDVTDGTNGSADIVNATSTSDKLASEEVEKW